MSSNHHFTEHLYGMCESTDYFSFSSEVDYLIDGLSPRDYDLKFSTCSTPDGILYSASIIIHKTKSFSKE